MPWPRAWPPRPGIATGIGRQVARADAPAAPIEAVEAAVAAAEASLGGSLSAEQREAATGIATSGRGGEIVVGVAGAGKTTMLAVVASAFEASGHRVVGPPPRARPPVASGSRPASASPARSPA